MSLPASLKQHRVHAPSVRNVLNGVVRWEPIRSFWFTGMALGATIGGAMTFSWAAFAVFAGSTALLLLLGHSVGMHRKLIHNSFDCPKWLEYALVYCGVLVGLAGPLGLLRTHDLRDYAQRLPNCHDFLAHRRKPLLDFWWQVHCELKLTAPPSIHVETTISQDIIYRLLQRTWMAQQLPWAGLLFACGGWGYVCWGVCARVTAGIFGHWLIGYFAHNKGQMHHEVVGAAVQGRNIRGVALLTMGECWHNNHHAFPGSAKLGLYPGEWDPGWWLLSGLAHIGLAWNLKTPADLATRPELRRLPPTKMQPSYSKPSTCRVCITFSAVFAHALSGHRSL